MLNINLRKPKIFLLLLMVPFFVTAQIRHFDIKSDNHEPLKKGDDGMLIGPSNSKNNTRNETREISTSFGLSAKRVNDLVYFFNDNSIISYDLESGEWANEYPLISPHTSAFTVNETFIYVLHSNDVYRYPLSGGPEQLFLSSSLNIEEIHTYLDYVLVDYEHDIYTTYDMITAQMIDENDDHIGSQSALSVPSLNRVYSVTHGSSPQLIRYMEADDDGVLSNLIRSPYHTSFQVSERLYYSSQRDQIIDGAGIVYNASDLTFAGSLAGGFDHIDFYNDQPILLKRNQLFSYSKNLAETGVITFPTSKDTFYIKDNLIYLFDHQPFNIDVTVVHMDDFTAAEPVEPVSPVNLTYTPDAIVFDQKNHLYLLSNENKAVYQYELSTQSYQEKWGLIGTPVYMAYSAYHDLIYLAYDDNRVTSLDPKTGKEEGIFNTIEFPCGLTAVNEYIFVCDLGGSSNSRLTYHSDGTLISFEEYYHMSEYFVWSGAAQKLFTISEGFSGDVLMSLEVNGDGVLVDELISPYEGNRGFVGPMCTNTSGSLVLLGSGEIYHANDLTDYGSLSNSHKSCGWSKDRLYTIKDQAGSSLQSWDSQLNPLDVGDWSGDFLGLFVFNSDVVVVVHELNGEPQFELLNDDIFKGTFE